MWGDIAIAFVIAFITAFMMTPYTIKLARKLGAVDTPKDARRVNKVTMPRLGGLGIYGGFLLGYMIFGEQTPTMNAILIGSFVLLITGIIDDIKPMKASHKLICQFVAALIVVIYGDLLLRDVSFFGMYINFDFWAYPITILFTLFCDMMTLIKNPRIN